MRAGSLRQRLETSAATPASAPADLVFGLGARTAADVVRVLWPSGILQAGDDRRSPQRRVHDPVTSWIASPRRVRILYTWNGARFEFVTDFMGGGEMGYWAGARRAGTSPIPTSTSASAAISCRPRDGRYELRVTNELEEALFVDRLQLVAVDHPASVDVFPNEGLRSPRTHAFRLLRGRAAAAPAARRRRARPRRAADRLRALDRRYPTTSRSTDPRLRGAARARCSTSAPARRRRRPAADRLDRLRVLERQRRRVIRRAALEPPALEVKDAPARGGR